jgi:hypothetical protein
MTVAALATAGDRRKHHAAGICKAGHILIEGLARRGATVARTGARPTARNIARKRIRYDKRIGSDQCSLRTRRGRG